MRSFFKFLYPTFILAAICLIVSLALSSTDMITKERIAKLEAENTEKAMKRVLAADSYELKTAGESEYYEALSGTEVAGYIFTTSASGYGGEVKVMSAVLPDKTVKAIEILDVSNETPGLGQNAANEEFKDRYKGKSGELSVVKDNPGENDIKALTGATFTTRAVTDAVNEALALSNKIIGEGETNEE